MNFIEEMIQNAQERGEFKGLKNEGKPLNIADQFKNENHFTHGLVKQAGYTLPFIAERQGIERRLEEGLAKLKRAASYPTSSPFTKVRWNKTTKSFRKLAKQLNKEILAYNLKAPRVQFHMLVIDIEKEIAELNPFKKK